MALESSSFLPPNLQSKHSMKASFFAILGALSGNAVAQDAFEPTDFNITKALFANGVSVSALPDLAALVDKRSLSSPCTAAVRNLLCHLCRGLQLKYSTV